MKRWRWTPTLHRKDQSVGPAGVVYRIGAGICLGCKQRLDPDAPRKREVSGAEWHPECLKRLMKERGA